MDLIRHRLEDPQITLSAQELADRWFAQRIELIAAPSRHIQLDFGTVGKIRGAFGQVLARWGSPAARSGTVCTWSPPCAYHVLHQPRQDLAGLNYLPPYNLDLQQDTNALCQIGLTVHGFATDWLDMAEMALIEGLQHGLAIGPQPLRFEVLDRRLTTVEGLPDLPISDSYRLTLKTPLGIRHKDRIGLSAPQLFRGLRNQARSLARWQDAKLAEAGWDVSALAEDCTLNTSQLRLTRHSRTRRPRQGQQDGQHVPIEGWVGEAQLHTVPKELSPLLRLGQFIRVGAKTSHGAGWFAVEAG